jgi:hypothetical protein
MISKSSANPWAFGVLEPIGDNWVWKEKTAEELTALGIPLFERDEVAGDA